MQVRRSQLRWKRSNLTDIVNMTSLLLIILIVTGVLPISADERESITWSDDGRYAFPLAGPLRLMAWERYHWDGSDEVDIMAHPSLAQGSPELARFERLPVVAVTDGLARRSDNERGGIAVTLRGDDGRVYYYSHLSQSALDQDGTPRRVSAGETIGTIGRSGRWSRYIETHLHYSVTGADGKLINAATWFETHFGESPIKLAWDDYPTDRPTGTVAPGGFRITRDFSSGRSLNPDAASVELWVQGPVVSNLVGEVRVMRNTVFGRRVQVTNRHTDQTIVISGLSEVAVSTGDTVQRGERLGYAPETINVMYFDRGILKDPLPMMLVPAEKTDHAGKEKNQSH